MRVQVLDETFGKHGAATFRKATNAYASRISKRVSAIKLPHFEIRYHQTGFTLVWLSVVLIYAIDAAYLMGVSAFYYWALYTPAVVINIESSLHLLPIATLKRLVWAFPLLSVAHLYMLAQILVLSIKQRRLALDDDRVGKIAEANSTSHKLPKNKLLHLLFMLLRFCFRWFHHLFTVEGKHYDAWFTLHDFLQITSQTYQCYSMSHLVTSRWINQLAVGACFLNCVTTPLIRLIVVDDLARQRFLCVMCDCWLGFIQAVGIPFIIFYPFCVSYDSNTQYFPDELIYSDTWYVEAINQLDQIMIVSYFDFAMTLLPHWSFLRSLRGICRLIRREEASLRVVHSDHTKTVPMVIGPTKPKTERSKRKRRFMTWTVAHGLMCLIHGVAIIIIHLVYQNNDPTAGIHCRSHTDPWFTAQFACAVVEINCYRRGFRGNGTDISSSLQEIQKDSVTVLLLSHCPGIEIPVSIRELTHLIGLDIYNSTLVHWGSEAALTDETHPIFSYFAMELTNVSSPPEGIFGPDLPSQFTDVELHRTNLSVFPVDLDQHWRNVNDLYLEFCGLTAIPQSFSKMPLWVFSLVGNDVHAMDDQMFENATFKNLFLSNNPLQKIPETMGNVHELYQLVFEKTQVENMPDWVVHWYLDRQARGEYVVLTGNNTPFCDHWNDTSAALQLKQESQSVVSQACVQDRGSWKGLFPINIVAKQRLL